ncbi:MAG: hypothetical protein ABW178_12530 [Pseudoxanthomonas sp.]
MKACNVAANARSGPRCVSGATRAAGTWMIRMPCVSLSCKGALQRLLRLCFDVRPCRGLCLGQRAM